MANIIIAVDGPAASGKGTLARRLAGCLNYAYMDTGALYRAVAFEVKSAAGNFDDEREALAACSVLQQKLSAARDGDEILQNPLLRSDDIALGASKVAAIASVRERLLSIQREFAKASHQGKKGVILDGRDIGTVICPDADVKLFITAKDEIRAKRRMKELQSKGIDVKYGAVLADMRDRDKRDSGRKLAPLRPADDAVVIDSSDLSEDQVLEKALQVIEEKLN